MPNVSLDLLGESYESRAKPLRFQRTVNLYPEIAGDKGGLMSFPGRVQVIAGIGTDQERGSYDFEGAIYQVAAQRLYRIDVNAGTRTDIGEIAGSTRCTFASNSGILVIANGSGTVYSYNGAALAQITDTDLETPFFVAQLNNQWVYSNNKTSGRWVTSDAGSATTIDGLNYASAESNGDILHRPYVFRQQLLLFGARTIEPWWNTGAGNPPFDRQEGGIIEKGLGADYSIAHSDEALYFLGDDLRVYQMTGGQIQAVSTDAISYAITQYDTHSDAIGSVIQVGNQDLYILQFPNEGVTWAYSQQKGFWSQLSSGTAYGRYDAGSFFNIGGEWYVSALDGAVDRLSYTTYDDAGATFVRERVTRTFDSEYFGVPDRVVYWNSLKLRCTVGEGLSSGQGSDPQVMLYYSDDDGRTWEGSYTLSLGRLGDYHEMPMVHGLGAAYRRKWRIRVSDPVNFNLFELKANVDVGLE